MMKIIPRVLVSTLAIARANAFATAFHKCHVKTSIRLFVSAIRNHPSKWSSCVTPNLIVVMQSIVDEVMEEMKAAMKAKDTAKLNTIRLMRSSFSNAAIDLKTDTLTDEQVCQLDLPFSMENDSAH